MGVNGRVNIAVSEKRLTEQLAKAQKKLDRQILADCTPYVPFSTGALRSSGHIVEDGLIEWNTPYAHYMYEGELYVDEQTGKGAFYDPYYGFWSRPNATKVPSGKALNYSQSGTGAHWFEKAKAEKLDDWTKLVGRVLDEG